MKYIVILGDGMADYDVAEFGGNTILDVANKPNIDFMSKNGAFSAPARKVRRKRRKKYVKCANSCSNTGGLTSSILHKNGWSGGLILYISDSKSMQNVKIFVCVCFFGFLLISS